MHDADIPPRAREFYGAVITSRAGVRVRRRITLLGLAILGMASAAFVVRRPLMMSAPMCMAGRWHGCFDTFNGVVLMAVVTLPLAALVASARARRRLAAKPCQPPGVAPLVAHQAGIAVGPTSARRMKWAR